MDVQTENMDPPPSESQPSGKIRKGFKLFGKRKPGNIFSIRSKGDGNNKSPVIKSKTSDGLSDSPAPDLEQEPDEEKGQEASQGEMEQAGDEIVGEDGVLAAAPARMSFSSVSSAKSLGFLSLLRGGRKGTGDRRVHTVSQPVGRQRRGLKGLFGNVKLRSKDKEDKEETPPSPLLMSSRANSVEIIKEDLTLTPKCQPRSPVSPETESCEQVKSSTTHDGSSTSSSEKAANVSTSNEHGPPVPTCESPLVPGDKSLSSLLADISSLLTFDSISGGGDIMADVEAEWGKASNAISTVVTDVAPSSTSLFSKSTISSPPFSTAVSTTATAKPFSVAVPSYNITKASAPLSSFTTSSTLSSPSVKLSSDPSPAFNGSTSIKVNLTPAPTAAKPSTSPVTLTSFSAPVMSSGVKTIQSTLSCTSTTTKAPTETPPTLVKATSVTPTVTSSAGKLASEGTMSPNIASVSKPYPVASLPPVTAKPVTHSPVIPATEPFVKLNSISIVNQQNTASHKAPQSQSLSAEDSKAPVLLSTTATGTTKPSIMTTVSSSKTTTVPQSTTTPGSVSMALSTSVFPPTTTNLNKTPHSLITVSDPGTSSASTATNKTQPSPTSVSTPFLPSLDKTPPMTKSTPAPVFLEKMPSTTTGAKTHSVSTESPMPPALGHITVSQSKVTPDTSVSIDLPAPTQKEVQSKATPIPDQVPVSVTKDPVKMQATHSKASPSPVPISVSKSPVVPAQLPGSASMDTAAPASDPGCSSKASSGTAHIQISLPKTHAAPATAPSPVTSPSSPSAPWPHEAQSSVKTRGTSQTTVDHQSSGPNTTGVEGSQTLSSKTKEQQIEPPTTLPEPSKEKRPSQVKGPGLSKIPVVGGGRVGKIPVRESQNVNDEPRRDPPTPVQDERPHFNSHEAGSKDKICTVEANVLTSKHTQEESQQPQQPKVVTSSGRDSKIPVKHGTQPHTASNIPQTKDPTRSKIPTSKVPVRRVGNKPAATGGSTQIRK
ncbi:uncharacterized protein ACNS7B_016595 [Menidia menidia]